MNAVCGLGWQTIAGQTDTQLVNAGPGAEQFIGQHLPFLLADRPNRELTYWLREGRSNNAEVDYVCARRPHRPDRGQGRTHRHPEVVAPVRGGKAGSLRHSFRCGAAGPAQRRRRRAPRQRIRTGPLPAAVAAALLGGTVAPPR